MKYIKLYLKENIIKNSVQDMGWGIKIEYRHSDMFLNEIIIGYRHSDMLLNEIIIGYRHSDMFLNKIIIEFKTFFYVP